ncbi:hypothetical protein [Dongia sp.]|uniref:hypothetical protein n=1 Tax=Dongia sp. TaxID=1977262 RepID=UPI0035B2C602
MGALSQTNRLRALFTITSLAVTYVRHDIDDDAQPFEGLWHFVQYWGIHAVALGMFYVLVVAVIGSSRGLWIPEEADDRLTFHDNQLTFCILMTVLIAAIVILIGAHWIPSYDPEYSN